MRVECHAAQGVHRRVEQSIERGTGVRKDLRPEQGAHIVACDDVAFAQDVGQCGIRTRRYPQLDVGALQGADGVPVGTNEFYVPSSGAYNQTPRVAYVSCNPATLRFASSRLIQIPAFSSRLAWIGFRRAARWT